MSVSRDGDSIRVEVAEGTRAYRGILRHLARFPSLAPYLGLDVAQRQDLNPEVSGINLEGLTAGPDGTSLLLGFRGPLTPEGRAILLRLRNPEALVTTGGDPVFDETPDTLWLNRRGIRSIERVPGAGPARYFIVAGPVADRPPGFALFAWSGVPGEQPVEVEGSAARFDGDDAFRPEGMIVEEGGRRIILVSDDGRRKVEGMDCRALPAERQRFRMMMLELSDP